MTSKSLSFEFALLAGMSQPYVKSVLQTILLPESEARRLGQECDLVLPAQLASELSIYVDLLGPEVKRRSPSGDVPTAFTGSTSHCFTLSLWPHLYWVVNRHPRGSSWGVGFENQTQPAFREFGPEVVRPGVWTRGALDSLADHSEIYDGWDERSVVRFGFGSGRYEGEFVFGLLQAWRQV